MKRQAILFSAGKYPSTKDTKIDELTGVSCDIVAMEKRLIQIGFDVIKKEEASMADYTDVLKCYSEGDTLFVEGAKLDTTINNKWYSISLGLDYPSTIGVGVSVPSEKYIVASAKKVLLDPTGCWLKDLFKKKSNIVEVEVVEKNPYIVSDKQKFIEVVK